ncbi:hypothetical protein V6N13_108753 [Hibiscus sabdariffa]|uniref:Uncharacterized protein n=2 Tax=Hibiscus sabdariffa TaxID=183260 RepID=A0ABR2ARD2_9ROSI
MESTLELGLAETSEISSWPRLERQGLPLDSDAQRVTKKVKIRGEGFEQPGDVSLGDQEPETDVGDYGDVCMMDDNNEGGVWVADDVPPRDGAQQPTES